MPDVLDGAMVLLAIFTLNFAHPGFLLVSPTLHNTNGGVAKKCGVDNSNESTLA
jgi:hypothetical protein